MSAAPLESLRCKDMRLKDIVFTLCAFCLLAATAGSATENGRTVYKWVDEQGVTHYGDHIPPEYAAQEQHVINAQGVETERIAAQGTPDQAAAEEQKKIDAQQRA